MSKEDLTGENQSTNEDTNTDEQAPEDTAQEESLGEALGDVDNQQEADQKPPKDTVSLKKFMQEKKARQELEKKLADLQSEEDAGDDPDDSSSTEESSNDDIDEVKQKVSRLEAERLAAQRDQKFNSLYDTVLEKNPEYKGIADKETIKQLALNPANRGKTLSQVLETTYGNLVQGRASIETDTQTNTKPSPGAIDYDRASTDAGYLKEIKSDPKLKEEYDTKLMEELGNVL